MIEMAELSAGFHRRALSADGGFAWWYADLLDPEGNGIVCIWSLGLPFLPGSRRGGPARARPSVNVALYERGRQVLYLLQEHASQRLRQTSPQGDAHIGDSRFELEQCDRALTLRIHVDEPAPGHRSRLRADLELVGAPLQLAAPSPNAIHLWTPRLAHATGHARICLDDKQVELSGTGYFDGNASTRPLHDQGIESWRWARFALGDRSFVVYDVQGSRATTKVIEMHPDGSWRSWPSRPRFSALHWGIFGLRSPRQFELDLGEQRVVCTAVDTLEDGPFYQRFALRASMAPNGSSSPGHRTDCGRTLVGLGVYETVYPEQIDRPWQRPFVGMRTHRVGADNSVWLPLFSGWSSSRGQRLLTGVRERVYNAMLPQQTVARPLEQFRMPSRWITAKIGGTG